jgi:hypothetical protein
MVLLLPKFDHEPTFDELLVKYAASPYWQPPSIYNYGTPTERAKLYKLVASGGYRVVPSLKHWAEDVASVAVPNKRHSAARQAVYDCVVTQGNYFGRWVANHHLRTITQIGDPRTHFLVRTDRNRNLRTLAEQEKLYYGMRILVFGQSVGSRATLSCVRSGMGDTWGYVDFDTIGPSNTNRILAGSSEIGFRKVIVTANAVAEIDPYINQYLYYDGATDESLERIFAEFKPDLIIEAIDGIPFKYKIRMWAKRLGIPLIMPTDLGYGAIIDIERYDLDPTLVPFMGRLSDKAMAELERASTLDSTAKAGHALGIMGTGPDVLSRRMAVSMMEFERSLAGFAQVEAAAGSAGPGVSNGLQRIRLGHPLPTGRYSAGELADMNNAL